MSDRLKVDSQVEVNSFGFGGRQHATVVEDRGSHVLVRFNESGKRRLVLRKALIEQRTTAPLPTPSIEELADMLETASVATFEASGGVRGSLERLARAELQAVPKPLKPARSRVYLVFIREKACCHCRANGPSDPHHYGARGTGQKTDDFRCVPLCRKCHDHFHDHGTLPGMNKAATRVFFLAKQVDYLIEYHRKDTA